MTTTATTDSKTLSQFAGTNLQQLKTLLSSGFVVITQNDNDTSDQGDIEAWAYIGSLDFDAASPLAFGAGHTVSEAIAALESQLRNTESVK